MTEAEWQTATCPKPMLDFLREEASDRKLRLFAVACCRRILQWIAHEECRHAILVSEQYADGEVTQRDCDAAGDAVSLIADTSKEFVVVASSCAVDWTTSTGPNEWDVSTWSLAGAMKSAAYHAALVCEDQVSEHVKQANCLRDIFGNPFRPVSVEPYWLTSTVLTLATGIYADRAFDRMPILADALQDAGCDNDDILNHCRQPGDHVRGCRVVDLLLGKT
jgi:hypothetical protein